MNAMNTTLGYQSGVLEISTHVTSEVPGSIPRRSRPSCDGGASLFDSVSFIVYGAVGESPNNYIAYRAIS